MADDGTLIRAPRFGAPLGGTPRNAYPAPRPIATPTGFNGDPLQPGLLTRAPRETTTVAPDDTTTTTTQVGSPLNTLYGVSGDSYLTDDQRRLARQIQGKFDASMDRRDRELQRYSAPRLSSFAEDEALARGIAEAQGLNYRPPVDALGNPLPTRRPNAGGGGADRPLAPRVPGATNANPNNNGPAKWAQILSGLSSLAPLIFGKDAYGQFLNRGLLGTIKDKLFGPGASQSISDAQLEQIVNTGTLPGGDGMVFNPITGMPMTSYGGNLTVPTGNETDPFESIYQGGNSSGLPDWVTSESNDFWGSGPAPWDSWTPDSGGDILDLFGGV